MQTVKLFVPLQIKDLYEVRTGKGKIRYNIKKHYKDKKLNERCVKCQTCLEFAKLSAENFGDK